MAVELPTESETLATNDFDEPDGSATYDGMDYVDGAEHSPALAFKVPGSLFYQIQDGAQLKVEPGQSSIADNSRIGVAVKTPMMKSPQVLDDKRIRAYDELTFADQQDRSKNEFTLLDLSHIEDGSVEVEQDGWILLTYSNADATNDSFNPANVDLELEVEKGRMADLEAAMGQ